MTYPPLAKNNNYIASKSVISLDNTSIFASSIISNSIHTEKINKQNIDYSTQCAAVRTYLLLISVPPQMNLMFRKITTCHGHSPGSAKIPYFMFGSNARRGRIPQAEIRWNTTIISFFSHFLKRETLSDKKRIICKAEAIFTTGGINNKWKINFH